MVYASQKQELLSINMHEQAKKKGKFEKEKLFSIVNIKTKEKF